MNKLTEIKECINVLNNESHHSAGLYYKSEKRLAANSLEYVEHLISLLEEKDKEIREKDKALAFYADEENHKWSHTYDETGEVEEIPSKVANDRGRLARKALNTSSNQEGES